MPSTVPAWHVVSSPRMLIPFFLPWEIHCFWRVEKLWTQLSWNLENTQQTSRSSYMYREVLTRLVFAHGLGEKRLKRTQRGFSRWLRVNRSPFYSVRKQNCISLRLSICFEAQLFTYLWQKVEKATVCHFEKSVYLKIENPMCHIFLKVLLSFHSLFLKIYHCLCHHD